MKVQELIKLVNGGKFYSLYEVEDIIPTNVEKVASGLELNEHRWYSTAVDVYKCEDGFVGIRGAYQSFSEMQTWKDIDVICGAGEYIEKTTITYVSK